MRIYYQKSFFFFVATSALWLYAFSAWAISVTVITPNGGECLTVGTQYNVTFSWSGGSIEHVALYLRTDGQQPTHLDTSTLQHPINIPNPGSPYRWTPSSSKITETGRIWIDGHDNNHDSLNIWDSSNADFAVRSSCAETPAPTPSVGGRILGKVPPPPSGFQDQAKAADVIPSTFSGRVRFESPWREGTYEVRFVEDRSGEFYNLAKKEVVVKPGDIIEFPEFKLKPNTFYQNKRYIIAYDFESSTESARSEVMRPFWTLPENPKQLEVKEIATSSAVFTLLDEVPNLGVGLSGALFEEVNSKYSSGWLSASTSWRVSGLDPDTQYQFWVKLRSGDGNETPSRALATFRTKALPPSGPLPEEVQAIQVKDLGEKVKKIAKIIGGYQELVTIREKEIKKLQEEAKEAEEVIEELPPEPPKPPEIPEEKIVAEIPLPEPPRPPQKFVVAFDGKNFNPASLEILEGDSVEWRNSSLKPVWPAVNPHPTHTGLLGFDAQGFLLAGEFYRFTFRKTGDWPYHDHQTTEKGEKSASGDIVVKARPVPEVTKIAEEKIQAPLPSPLPIVRKVRKPVEKVSPAPLILSEEFKEAAKEALSPIKLLLPSPVTTPVAKRPSKKFVVLFDEGRFNPQVLEINSGDTVRFINQTDRPVWPASDPHPTHTGLFGFDSLGDLSRNESYEYTFAKTGSVPYHNHTVAKADDVPEAGVITVKP